MAAPTDTVPNLANYLDQVVSLNGLKVPVPPPPPSPPPLPPPLPPSDVIYADTFSGTVLSSKWTSNRTPPTSVWVQNNGVVSQTSVAAADPKQLVLTGVVVPPSVQARAKCRIDSKVDGNTSWRIGLGLRTGGNGGGYSLLYTPGGLRFLSDFVAWTGLFPFTMDVGTWYNFAIGDDGTTLFGKAWKDGDPEPDWMFSQAGTVWTNRPNGFISLNGSSGGMAVSYSNLVVSIFSTPSQIPPSLPPYSSSPPPPPPPPSPPPPPPVGGVNITISFNSGITPSQQAIFVLAAQRWQRFIQDPTRTVVITAQGQTIDGQGGILGSGAPTGFSAVDGLPISGTMAFDSADLTWAEQNGYLLDIITHEMGHVLGFGTCAAWLRLTTGFGGTDPEFIGAQAVAAYNQRFGKSGALVPVENSGGPGTASVHWRESVFGSELMTGYYNAGTVNPLSAATAGAMADMGWKVSMAGAEAYLATGSRLMAGEHDGYRVTAGLTVVGHDSAKTPRHGKRCKVTR